MTSRRCPGIVEHLPLNAIASFLNVTPQMLSRIRKDLLLHDGEKVTLWLGMTLGGGYSMT